MYTNQSNPIFLEAVKQTKPSISSLILCASNLHHLLYIVLVLTSSTYYLVIDYKYDINLSKIHHIFLKFYFAIFKFFKDTHLHFDFSLHRPRICMYLLFLATNKGLQVCFHDTGRTIEMSIHTRSTCHQQNVSISDMILYVR